MILSGTKAWAKAVLKDAGVKRVMVAKRSTRLANASLSVLYREINRRGLN